MLKKISRDKLIFFGGAIAVYLIVQIIFTLEILNNFWVIIILSGGVMAIVSLGLNLIYGFSGQFSLGQWGFYAIGAYTGADITYRWTISGNTTGLTVALLAAVFSGILILLLRNVLSKTRGLDPLSAFGIYLVSVITACVVAVIIGSAIEPAITAFFKILPELVSGQLIFVLSVLLGGIIAAEISFIFGLPVLTLGSDYFGIATLGFTIIVKVLLDNSDSLLGFVEMKGARGMVGIPKMTTWFWVFLFLLIAVVVTRNFLDSSYGRAIVSLREDEIASKAMGINVADYKNLVFVIGSFFAGSAGTLYAHINGFLHPSTFDFIASFNPLIVVVFGGLGSVTGTVFASFAWALVLEGFLRLFLPQGFETWRFVVYPLLLIIMMLLKPNGLFGNFEIPFLKSILPPLPKTAIPEPKPESREGAAQ
jgi:branched-chain amino acid transport system permease protein